MLRTDVSLILCLLFADIVQAMGFMTGYRWLALGHIEQRGPSCSAQGFFLEMGDSASSFFACAIALHLILNILKPSNPKVPDVLFRYCIAGVWLTAFLFAFVPVVMVSKHIYGDVGIWCWIRPQYGWLRLFLHSLWLFVSTLLSIVVYTGLGIYLWLYGTKQRSPELKRVARRMFLYPIIYTLGTLPLATVRALSLAGYNITMQQVVGCSIAFSALGGIHCAVYVLTRRAMLRRELDGMGSGQNNGGSTRPLPNTNDSYLGPVTPNHSKSTDSSAEEIP